jgi:hypothetical protein
VVAQSSRLVTSISICKHAGLQNRILHYTMGWFSRSRCARYETAMSRVFRHTPYNSILFFSMVGLLLPGPTSCTAERTGLELTEPGARPASSVKSNESSGEKWGGGEVSIQHLQPASWQDQVHSALGADRPNSFWRGRRKGWPGDHDEERQLFSMPTRRGLLQYLSGRFLVSACMQP